jgi:nucleoside-diphosphate-sugar epimerase
MGDGRILRDFLYIDDAVNAMLIAAASDKAYGQIFNVGSGIPTDFITLAETIIRIAGSGRCDFSPFSKERKELEPGDYYTDITKIKDQLGWKPKIELEDGLRMTIDFYRQHRQHYWSPNESSL